MQDYSITSQSKGKHLTNQDRLNIERWHNKEGLSNREIARLLNKAHGTINREMKRGEIQLKRKVKYSAKKAQENYEGLRAHSVRPSKLTTEIDCYVSTRLKEDKDSLEVIHQALKGVSLSSLYNWVNWGWLEAKRHHLFYPQYKAAKKIKPRAPKHPFGKSIEERPEFINNRLEVGHYEIDTVILTRAKNKVLLTLTERKYRTEIIRLIDGKTAQAVNDELVELQKSYDFKSITPDNGHEFARLSEVVSCPVYYAHAYASFERGTNENHNRMIRRHLPKGTTKTTPEEVAAIEYWMNHYPRKMFNYKSSYEMSLAG
ncbi:IS30 family transposase [Lactococcus lactis]|uniref:IS30 family transposase n=1 Tax=Lactococcus lactis TaxID=1358 RepID=UPI001258455F|nr:IS30 family transposase [Lactococcus lactis]TYR26662.1 IS30 family transposase [Lactococcus lactis subsp. lactis bv. diacetylactis]